MKSPIFHQHKHASSLQKIDEQSITLFFNELIRDINSKQYLKHFILVVKHYIKNSLKTYVSIINQCHCNKFNKI